MRRTYPFAGPKAGRTQEGHPVRRDPALFLASAHDVGRSRFASFEQRRDATTSRAERSRRWAVAGVVVACFVAPLGAEARRPAGRGDQDGRSWPRVAARVVRAGRDDRLAITTVGRGRGWPLGSYARVATTVVEVVRVFVGFGGDWRSGRWVVAAGGTARVVRAGRDDRGGCSARLRWFRGRLAIRTVGRGRGWWRLGSYALVATTAVDVVRVFVGFGGDWRSGRWVVAAGGGGSGRTRGSRRPWWRWCAVSLVQGAIGDQDGGSWPRVVAARVVRAGRDDRGGGGARFRWFRGLRAPWRDCVAPYPIGVRPCGALGVARLRRARPRLRAAPAALRAGFREPGARWRPRLDPVGCSREHGRSGVAREARRGRFEPPEHSARCYRRSGLSRPARTAALSRQVLARLSRQVLARRVRFQVRFAGQVRGRKGRIFLASSSTCGGASTLRCVPGTSRMRSRGASFENPPSRSKRQPSPKLQSAAR